MNLLLGLDFLISVSANEDLAAMQVTIEEQEVRIGNEGILSE